MNIKVRKFYPLVLLVTLLFSSFSGMANAAIYEDTDWLSCWRVTSQGSIYTPVSLTARVMIDSVQVSGSDFITMKREDMIAETLSQYWASFPNASLNVGTLYLRGITQSLPWDGTYWSDPSYTKKGKYNDSQQLFDLNYSSSNYGKAVFFTGSGGMQTNNTAQVDFTW